MEQIGPAIVWGAACCGFIALVALTLFAMATGAVESWLGIACALFVWSLGTLYTLQRFVEQFAEQSQVARMLGRSWRGIEWLFTPDDWRGAWDLGSIAGARVRVHWTLLIALVVIGNFHFALPAWAAVTLIILTHELGHLALVRLFRLRPRAIVLHGAGGECSYTGQASPVATSVIAWGGVLAQAALLLIATHWPGPHGERVEELLVPLGAANKLLMLINLFPMRPLDGYEALRLPVRLWRARRAPRKRASISLVPPLEPPRPSNRDQEKPGRYLH